MKKLCIHIGIGIGLFILFYFAGLIFNVSMDWLDNRGIVGASWLGLATWELMIGMIVILALWIITLFGLPFGWHDRFHKAAMNCVGVVFVLGGGVVAVAILGLISLWFYGKGLWPVGMIFRLVEIGAALSVLVCLGFYIFGMVYAMFLPSENAV